jgi:hypothetical protein
MSLAKAKLSFLTAFKQVFLFTGPAESPTEKYNITPQVHEALIGMYLATPGIIVAPDGSEFVLELLLAPAAREAKQRLLDDAQAKVKENNRLIGPEPVEGSEAWQKAAWALALTDTDKALFERIGKARLAGSRIVVRATRPDEIKVLISKPRVEKKKKLEFPEPKIVRGDLKWKEGDAGSTIEFVENPEGPHFLERPSYIGPMLDKFQADEVTQFQQVTEDYIRHVGKRYAFPSGEPMPDSHSYP